MSVGAAKIVVTLPGCGDDGPSAVDAPSTMDAYPTYGLDDCHSFGTYDYQQIVPGTPRYTYHRYFQNAYGCPGYVSVPGLHCYPDTPDFAPRYSHFCFTYSYGVITSP